MIGNHTTLNKLARQIVVRDVCSPVLGIFAHDTPVQIVYSTWTSDCQDRVPSDPLAYVCLVNEGEKTSGWLDFVNVVAAKDSGGHVDSCKTPVDIGNCVAAETPLIEAASLFKKESSNWFLVLDGNNLIGCLAYQNLLSAPFRACLFLRLLALETLILSVVQTDADLALRKLGPKAARGLNCRFKRKDSAIPAIVTPPRASALVNHAYFSQKLNILERCRGTLVALPALSARWRKVRTIYKREGGRAGVIRKEEVVSRVKQVKDIRNCLAHPAEEWRLAGFLPRYDFHDFLAWLDLLERQLQDFLVMHQRLTD